MFLKEHFRHVGKLKCLSYLICPLNNKSILTTSLVSVCVCVCVCMAEESLCLQLTNSCNLDSSGFTVTMSNFPLLPLDRQVDVDDIIEYFRAAAHYHCPFWFIHLNELQWANVVDFSLLWIPKMINFKYHFTKIAAQSTICHLIKKWVYSVS